MRSYKEQYATGSISEALSRISQLHVRLTHPGEVKVLAPHLSFFSGNSDARNTQWTLDAEDDWEVAGAKGRGNKKTSKGHRHRDSPAAAGPRRVWSRVEFNRDGERYLPMHPLRADKIHLDLSAYTRIPLRSCDDKGVAIETPEAKVWAYNTYVMKHTGKALATDLRLNPSVGPAHSRDFPSGLSVFEPLDTDLGAKAFAELPGLFGMPSSNYDPRRPNGQGRDILFFGKKGQPENPYIPATDALREIQEKGFHNLHDFIVMHINAILATTGGNPEIIDEIAFNLLRYMPEKGILAHIDNISDFGGQFGPIFTVAMGRGAKYLDLLPILTHEEKPSIRLITKQFQTVMIQGEARSDYAHAVPCGNREMQYTIAFKFPLIEGGTPGPTYHSDLFGPVPTVELRVE